MNSIPIRKAIEQSLDILEAKANSLTTQSPKDAATLALVNNLREETHAYFSKANLADKELAKTYFDKCKTFADQTDVPLENRISAYRPEIGFGEIINRILIGIATVLSLGTLLAAPAIRYTFFGKTETKALTETVLEEVEKMYLSPTS